jgi:putative ABC transport system permease protein
VIVPLDTYLQRLARTQVAGGIRLQTLSQVLMKGAEARGLSDPQADVRETLMARRTTADPAAPGFQVQNQADAMASAAAISTTLTLFSGAIAGISLLVEASA